MSRLPFRRFLLQSLPWIVAAAPVAARAGSPIVIQTIGDSITQGLRSTDSYRATLRDELAKKGVSVEYVGTCPDERKPKYCWDVMSPAATLKHDGSPGENVQQLSDRIDSVLRDATNAEGLKKQARVVLLMIGTNDIFMQPYLDRAKATLQAMIGRVTREHPGIQFLVSTVPPTNPEGKLGRLVQDPRNAWIFNQVFNQLKADAPPNLHFVDAYSALDARKDLYDDGLHPTPVGDRKLAKVWFDGLMKLPLVQVQAVGNAATEGSGPSISSQAGRTD